MGCTDVDMERSHQVNEEEIAVGGTLFCRDHCLFVTGLGRD